ncbi:MAG: SurA N-terminal domain-containing protein [Bryobacteraceae bacterium]
MWFKLSPENFTAFPLLLLFLCPARAEIIDRIAVSVGSRVITESDLGREIRITAFQNNAKPDFSPANKRQTAERLVDQMLVRNELEASRYLMPSEAEAQAAIKEEKSRFADDGAYRAALAQYGITEDDLQARLLWQRTLVRFIDVRFRPGIQIGDDEIRNYFNDHMRPILLQAHPGQAPSLDDYRATIEQTLVSQAANQQVDEWLKQARRRTRIQFHDEVFV